MLPIHEYKRLAEADKQKVKRAREARKETKVLWNSSAVKSRAG
jgi:hypothetical protein